MIKRFGSQSREPIEESEYSLLRKLDQGEVILLDKTNGHQELWSQNNNFAGYVIEIDGIGYEFVTSL